MLTLSVRKVCFLLHALSGERTNSWVPELMLMACRTAVLSWSSKKPGCVQAAQFRPSFAQNFPQCNQQLCANTSIETSLSGTTGVTALLHGGNKLLVANLGDSRCMLGRVNAEGTVTAIPLSSDHSCDVPSEAARIRERKVSMPCASHFL